MEPFETKDGRLIIPKEHEVVFVGKNNSCKSKVLIYLHHKKGSYLSARQLHRVTGVSYDYLKQRLSFWFNIRYLNRKASKPAKGSPHWEYCIAERGEHFVTTRIPIDKRSQYVAEINAFIKTLRGK